MEEKQLSWHFVCTPDEIEEEDVISFGVKGTPYAVYHTKSGYYATEGLCPHEKARLADGLVIDEYIECPKHNSRFHIPSGKVQKIPARQDLKTFPVKIEAGMLYLGLPF